MYIKHINHFTQSTYQIVEIESFIPFVENDAIYLLVFFCV